MGVLDFFKKQPESKSQENKILLSMPIFRNGDSYHINDVIENLKSVWGLEISDIGGDDAAAMFSIDGEPVALAVMPVPIPQGDIEGTAKYAYNWPNALDELKDHTGHAIVSVMAGRKSPIKRYQILSKVLCSILMTTDAVGIYQGGQSLLIPRDQYLGYIEELKEGGNPIMLWIYIGLKSFKAGNCAYTYGLKDFQKKELEIVYSKLSLEELFKFLHNTTSYIIDSDITLKDGETIGYTADQKIAVTFSKGEFVQGQSVKLKL